MEEVRVYPLIKQPKSGPQRQGMIGLTTAPVTCSSPNAICPFTGAAGKAARCESRGGGGGRAAGKGLPCPSLNVPSRRFPFPTHRIYQQLMLCRTLGSVAVPVAV
ncbi:hypothetical protein Vafri_8506 [Volvox africanus]|nr:hypothetical protein Vafri_8506 [Volvox africanus]